MRTAFILSAVAAIAFGILAFWETSVFAAIPHLINYQGMLTDNSGTPLNGSYNIIFKIYNDPSAGTKKWEEIQPSVSVTNGLFNVILGSVTPINLDFSEDYWLDITVEGEHMPSRLRLTSVGYAYRALVADSALAVTPGSGSNWHISNHVLYSNSYWGIARGGAGNILTGDSVNTHVNLGVASSTGFGSPSDIGYETVSGGLSNTAKFSFATVGGGQNNTANYGYATVGGGQNNEAGGPWATVGGGIGNRASFDYFAPTVAGGKENTAWKAYATVGGGYENYAFGEAATIPGGYQDSAVGDYSFAAGYRAKAFHYGSFVWADSTNAVFSSDLVNEFAVRASGGMRVVSKNSLYGGYIDNQAGGGDGFRAYANVSKGNNWGAVYAINYGSSPAVYADGGGDTAAYFNGSVVVTGTLYKGSLAFVIDHPLDPENKYLYHSGVESPDMKNVYDGVVILDGNGEAWVGLPEWFEALNKEFRYQLTAMGASGPDLYIADEISNNRFRISGGKPGMKVSWQVTGIRKDPYAEKHRIPLEEEKSANDRGKYLHPDTYNLPETMGVNYSDKETK
jgi:hypothetical protein